MRLGWSLVLLWAVWLVSKHFYFFPAIMHFAGIVSGLLGILLLYLNRAQSVFLSSVGELFLTFTITESINVFGTFVTLSGLSVFVVNDLVSGSILETVLGFPALWFILGLGLCWWVFALYVVLMVKRWKRNKATND